MQLAQSPAAHIASLYLVGLVPEMNFWRNLPMGDKYMFATVIATLTVWWIYRGRKMTS